jgi:hypothetical protein
MNDTHLYPDHSSVSLHTPLYARGICDVCGDSGRVADDWCRRCGGGNQKLLADALSTAALELTDLRRVCLRALGQLRKVLPYGPRMPAETEQAVRRAIRQLEEMARG